MGKTVEEIEKLKRDWENDPCWDLYDTEGFEEYTSELMEHQRKCESAWNKKIEKEELDIDKKAEELGIKGLYRIILKNKLLLDRHERAIDALADGNNHLAYKILNGMDE